MRAATVGPHTRRMARRVTSSALVGRADELKAVHDAASSAKAGRARIVLVAGDAGIGKTRLIGELCARIEQEGMLAALGGCIQLGDASLAYAPLVEVLRELRRHLGAEALGALLGPGMASVGALLGDAGPPPSDVGAGALFEHLLGFLGRLGARQPALLVFEDMHWADPSTRDLVAFLGRNLREEAVALVLTYRTDELHRRHPLRTLLTDLERDPKVERIVLPGLTRPELITLLGEITAEPPTAEIVDDLVARTDGNPFYVEELMAAGRVGGSLPATLADAILSRVSELPAPTPSVLHQAAVLGEAIDDQLLADVTGQSPAQVADALREAVARQLLVIDESGCRFRHALVREALYDDLLPGERERLHVAAARSLQADGGASRIDEHARWTLLAHHAYAAHDLPLAFVASVRAGIESERLHAYAAAAGQFERAVQLWEQVPDPQAAAGMTRAELIMRAAEACNFSGNPRDVALAESALAALAADVSPEQRAIFLERLGRFNWVHLRGGAAVAAYEQAVALLADRPPSPEQAFTLSALGQSLMLHAQYREAEAVLQRAIAVAATVGALATQGHALCSLGPALVSVGRVDDGLAALYRAQSLCRAHGTTEDVCRVFANLVYSLYICGRYDEAVRTAGEGLAYAEATGHLRDYGPFITGNLMLALFLAGRWPEAEQAMTAFELHLPRSSPALDVGWLRLLLGQGRYDRARQVVNRLLEATRDVGDVDFRAAASMRAGELAALERRWADARRLLGQGLALARDSDDQETRSHGCAVALQAEADRLDAPTSPDSDEIREARDAADRLIDEARRIVSAADAPLPQTTAWLATAEAEHARVHGRDDARTWDRVAALWDGVGQLYPAARARYRQADALLRTGGDRGLAAEAARAAVHAADRLGAARLAADIRQLAQRGRLDLADAPDETPPPLAEQLHITPREAQVLGQLAIGRTNRQIAEALFISEKTASVHVTNLLRKLGVTSRIQAAAIAQRAGLTDG
jgi:DNA-binding CsgD family transcriptional regulator/tetratricopeptide (TPR) repeat protein